MVKVGYKVISSLNRSHIGATTDLFRVSLYMFMSQNVMKHFGEGNFIMFDEIPIATVELNPERRFQTFPDISLSEELLKMKVAPPLE